MYIYIKKNFVLKKVTHCIIAFNVTNSYPN